MFYLNRNYLRFLNLQKTLIQLNNVEIFINILSMIIKISYVRNFCNRWISMVQHPATSSLVVQGFINKPMSRRILVIYFCYCCLLSSIKYPFLHWHSSLFIFIQQLRMTDSKYFSTTRKGKPKFWSVQFTTWDRTNKKQSHR